jgi:hypothetical protein
MLTTSHIPGTPTYAFIVEQILASSEPTGEQPPALSWRFGQCRRWHPEFAFLYSTTNTAPAAWASVSNLRATTTTPLLGGQNFLLDLPIRCNDAHQPIRWRARKPGRMNRPKRGRKRSPRALKKQNKWRQNAILNGLCQTCHAKLDTDTRRCSKCVAKNRKAMAAYKLRIGDLLRRKARERTRRVRERVIAKYGGKCQCPGCGISQYEWLVIDHVNGGGCKERREKKFVTRRFSITTSTDTGGWLNIRSFVTTAMRRKPTTVAVRIPASRVRFRLSL